MPLIPSRSKKAFSKNIETEMAEGKPQKQSIAIAYSMKRKAGKKKMAEGGAVNESAATEHRPSIEEHDKDAAMVSRNSGNKAPKNDSWTDKSTVTQAQMNNGRSVKPIKRPGMVPTNAFSTRMYDEEADLQSSAKTGNPDAQPPKHDDEEGPDRQGPRVSDEEHQHNNGRKAYAKGGSVSGAHDEDSAEHYPGKPMVDMEYGSSPEEDGVQHPAGLEEDNDQMRPSKEEYMSGKRMAPMLAAGGEITSRRMALDSQEPIHETYPTSDEEDIMHAASIAAAIMAKKRMMARGGEILSHDSIYPHPEADQADLSRNADEDANEEDQLSFNALRKENYSETAGLDALDNPMDSTEDGREIDHDKHDMLAEIRAKMKRRIR